jgi:hypothetical protein
MVGVLLMLPPEFPSSNYEKAQARISGNDLGRMNMRPARLTRSMVSLADDKHQIDGNKEK